MNDKERIEYFMSEIARLSNQVVDLQNERDALLAHVNEISKVINENSIDSLIIYQAKRILRQGESGAWLKDSNVNGGKRQGGTE